MKEIKKIPLKLKFLMLAVIFSFAILLPVYALPTSDSSIEINLNAPHQLRSGDVLKIWVSITNPQEEGLTQIQNISEQIEVYLSQEKRLNVITKGGN